MENSWARGSGGSNEEYDYCGCATTIFNLWVVRKYSKTAESGEAEIAEIIAVDPSGAPS